MPLHVASYSSSSCCSVGLLFQFVLAQFLNAVPSIRRLKELSEHLEDMHFQEGEARILQEISEIMMNNLLGLASNGKNFSVWNFGKGPLSQLRHHCYELHHAVGLSRAKCRPLLTHAKKSWSYCLQTHDHICIYNLSPGGLSQELITMRTSCMTALKKSLKHLYAFEESLFAFFHHFSDDENVLFYLWRHRQEFDTYCGRHFTELLFLKLFPNGIEQVQEMLISRYTDRQFHQLIPYISESPVELNYEQPT